MRWVSTSHWWKQLPGKAEWVCAKCGSGSKRVDYVFYEHRSDDVEVCEQLLEEL